jgi:hypothetical protein
MTETNNYETTIQFKIYNFVIERYAKNKKLQSFKLSDIKENFKTIAPTLLEEACEVLNNENLISRPSSSRIITYELNIELATQLIIKYQEEIETEKCVKKKVTKKKIQEENIDKENENPKKQRNVIENEVVKKKDIMEENLNESKIQFKNNVDKVKSVLIDNKYKDIDVNLLKSKVISNELNDKDFMEILTSLSDDNIIFVDENMIYCIN